MFALRSARPCLVTATAISWLFSSTASAEAGINADSCAGEFTFCPSTGECTLFDCDSQGPHCGHGQYRCPITNYCVDNVEAYSQCPGLKGTHLDHTLNATDRVSLLVGAANLTEMISQLSNTAPPIERLGIPGYNWLSDDEHGVRGWRTTYFPDGPGLGASFDKELLHSVGAVVGMEARGQHNFAVHDEGVRQNNAVNGDGITVYGPNMNLVRDPRWGRSQEVYSEDPRLSSALTIGYVTGIQGAAYNGTPNDATYMLAGACCKHYVAYDLEGNGPLPSRVYFNANVDTRSFWEHYMPVFDDCVNTAGAMHVMCSYNSMNGIPTCADPNLLDGVLREQWSWPGFVVSDYDAWANIFGTHHFTTSMEQTAAVGLNAGLDQEGGGTRVISQLYDAIKMNLTTSAAVQRAFSRLMLARIKLGMFDPPSLVPYNVYGKADLRTTAATALNRRAASEGTVLLKNSLHRGRTLLPLFANDYKGRQSSILVSGPLANNSNNTFGNYACDFGNCSMPVTSILGGLKFSGTDLDKGEVSYIEGCESTNCSDAESNFPPVVTAARKADLAIIVLGTLGWDDMKTVNHSSPNAWEREGHDRTSLALAGNQYKLVAEVAATGIPVVCVLIHGGSIELSTLLDDCGAIVDAWFPGQQGGAGVADVMFGKASPGRSPQTYYRDDSELPPLGSMNVYDQKGVTYRYYSGTPVIPFGAGLSFTTFEYTDLVIGATTIGYCDSVSVSVTVKNIGNVDGDEVVQLYVKTPEASVKAPRVRLADFARVSISKGESKRVQLWVTPKYHYVVLNEDNSSFWSPHIAIEQGRFTVHVGGGQPDFTKGVLSTSVNVRNSGKLTTTYECT